MNVTSGLGAAPRTVRSWQQRSPKFLYVVNRRGMGAAVIPVPRLVARRRGMGDCSAVAGSQWCRDNNSGSVVDCGSAVCAAPPVGYGMPAPPGPNFTPSQNTAVVSAAGTPGSTVDALTLSAYLQNVLYGKENLPVANLIAHGGSSVAQESADLLAQAQLYCTNYPSMPGCNNPQSIVGPLQQQFQQWAAGQSANVYNPNAGGSLTNPQPVSQFGAPSSAPIVATPNISPLPAPTAATPAVASIANVSRPGQSLQVGDTWRVTVSGPPNSKVAVTATQNGNSLGTTPMGNTDQSGNFSLSGTADSSTIGTWKELWTIGASAAPTISFSVAAVQAQQQAGGSNATAGGSSTVLQGSGSQNGAGSSSEAATAGALSSLSDMLTQKFTIGNFTFPIWEAALAGIAGVWFLKGK